MLAPILEPAPLSPARPAAWTDDMHEAAKAHAAESYPSEAVGIVERGQYVRLDNRSAEPTKDVHLSDEDLMRVASADVFFHSHPDGIGSPSSTDMVYQQQLGIPFVVIVWPLYDVFWWGDSLARAPLIGRGFRHGVHDCMSLIRDHFQGKGVVFADHPREWDWWAAEPEELLRRELRGVGLRAHRHRRRAPARRCRAVSVPRQDAAPRRNRVE